LVYFCLSYQIFYCQSLEEEKKRYKKNICYAKQKHTLAALPPPDL